MTRSITSLALCAGLVACGAKNVRDVATWTTAPRAPVRVGIVPTTTAASLLAPDAAPMDVFRDNLYIGRIRFAGGYEILEEEDHQARSVVVDLTEQERFTAQGTAWLDTAVREAAGEAGWQVVDLPAADWVPAPSRTDVRGTTRFDGSDNVNLPRMDLRPASATVPAYDGVDYVLTPILVHYYAHNAGWFVGQELGAWGGARTRVVWAMYEPGGRAVVAWGEVGTQVQRPRLGTPNMQQLQDLLITTEQDAAKRLTTRFRKAR